MEERLYEQLYEMNDQHWWFISKKKIVLDILERHGTKSTDAQIVDLACGSGLMLKSLHKFGKVTGIDISQQAIKFCRQIDPEANLILGDLNSDNVLPNEYADTVLALDMLEHFQNDEFILKKLNTVMKLNGILLLTVPAYQFLWSRHDDIHGHFRRYTKKELHRKLEKSGFEIVKLSYYNSLLFLPAAAVRITKKLIGNDQDDLVVPSSWINRVFTSIFSSESFWLRVSTFPFGLSLIGVVRKNQMM